MHESLTISQCAELLRVTRNGAVESRHLGVAVVLDPDGQVVAGYGDPDALIFPRSALKPFQAIASLRAGARLTEEQLALACASHVGTERHQRVAEDILHAVGLDAAALRCPAAWPADSATRQAVHERGGSRTPLAFNCSGKHAAFLNAASCSGLGIEDYLCPDHPVQRAALATIAEFCGPISLVGTDGCGAPAPQLSLRSLAAGFGRLALSDDPAAVAVRGAVRRNPWAIRGEGTPNTLVVQRTGTLAKLGAEGVLAMGTVHGYGVALKLLDGASRGTDLLALGLLASAGALEPEDHRWLRGQLVRPPATAGAAAAGLELVGTDFGAP